MTSIPASRRARAMIFAPRSWPSRPGLAITTRILRAMTEVSPLPLGQRVVGAVGAHPPAPAADPEHDRDEQDQPHDDSDRQEEPYGAQPRLPLGDLAQQRAAGGAARRRSLLAGRGPVVDEPVPVLWSADPVELDVEGEPADLRGRLGLEVDLEPDAVLVGVVELQPHGV